jgi:hypothetical protein
MVFSMVHVFFDWFRNPLSAQPVPLESLVSSVLGLGDYTTFSAIMRLKVPSP